MDKVDQKTIQMISINNKPENDQADDESFTIEAYRNLLYIAVESYNVVSYRNIPWGENFLLWRHDCDYSLNRALALAKIEAEIGMTSTFFINPHSEFYNFFELNQLKLIQEIADLGHDIGLHFDGLFYKDSDETVLGDQVACEADLIAKFTGVRPAVFSFHNPSEVNLACESDTYGGLVNCYSKRFKTSVSYCSDSNGYWRFRPLAEVLTTTDAGPLQILTHPGWWHDKAMPARQRIFTSVYGRASKLMRFYDQSLLTHGRSNLAGPGRSFMELKTLDQKRLELCDYLWNKGHFQTLFLELWQYQNELVNNCCSLYLQKLNNLTQGKINAFLNEVCQNTHSIKVLTFLIGSQFEEHIYAVVNAYRKSSYLHEKIISDGHAITDQKLKAGCVDLSELLQRLERIQTTIYEAKEIVDSVRNMNATELSAEASRKWQQLEL